MHKRYFYPIQFDSQIIPKQYHNCICCFPFRDEKIKDPCAAKCKCVLQCNKCKRTEREKVREIFAHTKIKMNFNNNRYC